MTQTNDWEALKRQFDALAQDASAAAVSIDEILDVQFRRRLSELVEQTARRNSPDYNWPLL